MARFLSQNSSPPGGVYFFELNGERVQSKSKVEICARVKMLYYGQGYPVPHTPFDVIMDYMCPYMPEGFCSGTGPHKNMLSISKLQENTRALFGRPVATPVRIRERLQTCIRCRCNSRAECPSCVNLAEWVIEKLNTRSRIPADELVHVCVPAGAMVSALVSIDDPGDIPDGCPERCWRHYERKS
jgi:hypothetical protein